MHYRHKTLIAAFVTSLALAPAFAGNGNGHGKHGGGKHHDKQASVQKHGGKHHAGKSHGGVYEQRYAYADNHRVAGCPPGLAKKNNGCLPPGQAKKLAVGQPLPHGAVYSIPSSLNLPPPPLGHRYAIVNNQVVLVSSGNIVVDIIRSLLG